MKKKKRQRSDASQNGILREMGRIVAGAYYDHQAVRVSSKNRMRDVVRKKNEGIKFDEVEEKKPKAQKFAEIYKDKQLPQLLNAMLAEDKLTEQEHRYIERVLGVSKEAEAYENKYKSLMLEYVSTELMYEKFLQHIRGLGEVLSANLLKEFGYCEKYEYVSSLWRHCGLHVVDGVAPKRRKGQKLDFNPKLRTLCWKISDSFVKQRTPVYRGIYDSEKERQSKLAENKAENAPKNKLHADLRARRKMVKIFLQHYWITGRKLVGLKVSEPYSIGKMGHKHYIKVEEVIKANKKGREI